MINFVFWKWNQPGYRDTYTAEHANIMANMLSRNLTIPHRIILVTDDPAGCEMETFPLWDDHSKLKNASGAHLPSCYRRLRLFDPAIQKQMGIEPGARICSVDLDTCVIQKCDNLFTRKEKFVGWGVRGTYHQRVFNGSMWVFNAGEFEDIWKAFNPLTSPRLAFQNGFMGSDQGWISYNLARRTDCASWGWPVVASFPREIYRIKKLDVHNLIVFFHGRNKPWQESTVKMAPWLNRYYRKEPINEQQVA